MTREQLDSLQYFSINELDYKKRKVFIPEVLENTDFSLMKIMDVIRLSTFNEIKDGLPIRIHCIWEDSRIDKDHVNNSWHYKGKAIDFHFITKLPYKKQVRILQNIIVYLGLQNKLGIGYYPLWGFGDPYYKGGFHIDNRGCRRRWGQILKYENKPYDKNKNPLVYVSELKILEYINK